MFKSNQRPPEQIEQLEIRIEELRNRSDTGRRLMLAGRACVLIGPVLLVCVLLGLVNFTPVRMIVGLALAMAGSCSRAAAEPSTQQLEFLLRQTEKERNTAIDSLELIQAGDPASEPRV